MKKSYVILFAAIGAIAVVNSGHAAIIHYDVSGTMVLSDTNWNSIVAHEMSGYMLISDVDLNPDAHGVTFDIESFTFLAGGYEWSGTGSIHGYTDRFLILDGPGDWEVSTGLIPGQSGWDWSSQYQLPASMTWPGDGWHFGDELFSRVDSLSLQAVPIPAAAWLFLSGLAVLTGLTKGGNQELQIES